MNNRELLLRTLAGFMVHPNVGAVLALDLGTEAVDNRALEHWLRDNGYPIDHVPHVFHTVGRDIEREIDDCEALLGPLLEAAGGIPREPRPCPNLKSRSNAAANPSGGNLFRGLYNITLKSLGAALKKSPDVRLDHVID